MRSQARSLSGSRKRGSTQLVLYLLSQLNDPVLAQQVIATEVGRVFNLGLLKEILDDRPIELTIRLLLIRSTREMSKQVTMTPARS